MTDDQGVPLPGSTILEQVTANRITTDFDGNFIMEVADGATLEVSILGYESQTQSGELIVNTVFKWLAVNFLKKL